MNTTGEGTNRLRRTPLVSICIPTFNKSSLLEIAVRSALDQGYPNIEIVVTDNASTDGTVECVGCLQKSHPNGGRIRYFSNSSNIGMTGNFRRAFELSSGEYITFLCDDDYLYPNAVIRTVNALESDLRSSFVFGNIEYIGDRSGKTAYSFPAILTGDKYLRKSLKEAKNLTFLTGSMFRRSVGQTIGISDLFFFDWYLWLQLALRGDVLFISHLLGVHRYHSANETKSISTIERHHRELQLVLDRFAALDEVRNHRQLSSLVLKSQRKLYLRYLNFVRQDSAARSIMPHINSLQSSYKPGAWTRAWALFSPYWIMVLSFVSRLKKEIVG